MSGRKKHMERSHYSYRTNIAKIEMFHKKSLTHQGLPYPKQMIGFGSHILGGLMNLFRRGDDRQTRTKGENHDA